MLGEDNTNNIMKIQEEKERSYVLKNAFVDLRKLVEEKNKVKKVEDYKRR